MAREREERKSLIYVFFTFGLESDREARQVYTLTTLFLTWTVSAHLSSLHSSTYQPRECTSFLPFSFVRLSFYLSIYPSIYLALRY